MEVPVGIMPREIWLAKRKAELIAAMERYAKAGKPIPLEWIIELRELS